MSEFWESGFDASWRILGAIVPAWDLLSRPVKLRPSRHERLPPDRRRHQRRRRLLPPPRRLLPPRHRLPHISSNLKTPSSPLVHNPFLPSNPRSAHRLPTRPPVQPRSSRFDRLLNAFPPPTLRLTKPLALRPTTLVLLRRLPRAILPLRRADDVGAYKDASQSSRPSML